METTLDTIVNLISTHALPNTEYFMQAFSKECVAEKYFLISQPKHMLWVLKRTVSMRQFF